MYDAGVFSQWEARSTLQQEEAVCKVQQTLKQDNMETFWHTTKSMDVWKVSSWVLSLNVCLESQLPSYSVGY